MVADRLIPDKRPHKKVQLAKSPDVDLNKFSNKRILFLSILGILFLILIGYGIFPWKCPIKYFIGIECPGCGFSRGFCHFIRGNIVDAFRLNPLSIVFGIAVLLLIILLAYDVIARRSTTMELYGKINEFISSHKVLFIGLSVIYVVVFTIYRNQVI